MSIVTHDPLLCNVMKKREVIQYFITEMWDSINLTVFGTAFLPFARKKKFLFTPLFDFSPLPFWETLFLF